MLDRPSRALDARRRRTRAALYEALLALLDERPFDQITIREITSRAQVGYASFFRHYPGKEALLNDLAADQIATLIALTQPAFRSVDTPAAALALCTYVGEHRRLWSALLTGGAAGIMREEFARQAARVPPGPHREQGWLPAELGIIHGVASTVEILAWWLQRWEQFTIEEVATILDRLVMRPITA